MVILILSTLLVISLGSHEEGSPVYLAKNDWPSQFKSTQSRGETMIFTFGVICKEAFKQVEVRYTNLFMAPKPEFADPEFLPNQSQPIEIMEARKDIHALRENLGNVSVPIDILNVTARGGNLSYPVEYTGVIYDFSRTLGLFLNHSLLGQISMVYAVLKGDNGEILYFTGVPDFFYRRSQNIKYLSISHNQNETVYQETTELSPDTTPIEAAPPSGSITFDNTEADDQILIQMNVESTLSTLPHRVRQMEHRRYMIQHVRVYANGELEVNEMNLVPFEKGGWSL